MSIRHAAQPQFPLRGLREGPAAPWVRPADWPGLPWIPDNEQAFVGLLAVRDTDHESVAVNFLNNYTVDWGDGTVQNFAFGTKAEHTYNFATLTSRVTSRGYKTAIVKVTPQAGNNLTTINLQQKPTGWGTQGATSTPWLELQINSAFFSAQTIGGIAVVKHSGIERIHIRKHLLTSLNELCSYMVSLQSIPLFDTSAITSANSTFYYASSLREVPLFDFSNVLDATSLFYGSGIVTVPALNLSKATNARNMFYVAMNIHHIPDIIFGALVTADNFFREAKSLRTIGALDFSLVNNLTSSWYYNSSLVRSKIVGIKITHSIASCSLSATALNEIFTNLATVTGQTITITGNPGAATCDQSIATTKGWTVVN